MLACRNRLYCNVYVPAPLQLLLHLNTILKALRLSTRGVNVGYKMTSRTLYCVIDSYDRPTARPSRYLGENHYHRYRRVADNR